ncbi:hypothetical protein CK203_036471 [Vitis vinifera]|uniref:Uncharacterized protein n=1 Tax=Vitis vinifera TaxID=29760 RepID=A0A438HYS2_VITVI|nr:hypothetical protein CK203_036471 [Vitis vinifera]
MNSYLCWKKKIPTKGKEKPRKAVDPLLCLIDGNTKEGKNGKISYQKWWGGLIFIFTELDSLHGRQFLVFSVDCVSPILDVATRLWNCTAKRAVYIRHLPQNLNSLRTAMEELKNLYEDVKERGGT